MCSIKPVRTEAEYEATLARVSGLRHAEPGTPEGEELLRVASTPPPTEAVPPLPP